MRGTLRILLGSAPGVGKTYAMLEEAHQKQAAGAKVVAGVVLDHGRKDTAALLEGLLLVPPARISYRGAVFEEMDLDAVLALEPDIALVDEYAHTVAGGSGRKRWQDIEALLDAGIDVISTLNIQHLASLGDAVSQITSTTKTETVPDDVVRRAGQIELIDISPELLRQRLSAGQVYAPEKVDAALANYFRSGNLSALRELALLWLADQVEDGLTAYRSHHGIEQSWPTRERIVIGLTGGPEGEVLIRRAARILSRVSSGELLGVHVRAVDGLRGESPRALEKQRQLLKDLGGSYHSVTGEDPALALLDFARGVNATQLVVGTSRRRPLSRLLRGAGVSSKVVRSAGDLDVHMVPHPLGDRGVRFRRTEALRRSRVLWAFVMALLIPPLIQAFAVWVLPELSFTTNALLQLTGCIGVALLGGLWPALLAAVLSSLLLNFFSSEPLGSLNIADPETVLALVVFLAVSAVVAVVVSTSARRSVAAARAGAEAVILSDLARTIVARQDSLESFLEHTRETFRMTSAALLIQHQPSGFSATNGYRNWWIEASAGRGVAADPEQAEAVEYIDAETALVLTGRMLDAAEKRLLVAFGAQLMVLRRSLQLDASRQDNVRLAEGNMMRTAILRAVSHDLRTPLAAIKLSVSSLRYEQVSFSPEEEAELLATIEDSADRLDTLVGNLLDMSRISSDSAKPFLRPVRWLDAVEAALHAVPVAPGRVRADLPPNMPPVEADPGMLERVIANIVENALKYAGESEIVVVGVPLAGVNAEGRPVSELRIVDHGRGVDPADVVSMFQPFQRLDDVPAGTGVGLGLAVAKGFTESMSGTLSAELTPGGGLTMVIRLPLSTGAETEPRDDQPAPGERTRA